MKSSIVSWNRRLVVGLIAIAGAWAVQAPGAIASQQLGLLRRESGHGDGVVKEWQWVNPHTWLHLTADDGKGGKVEWEARRPRAGRADSRRLDPRVLKPGDTVTVHYSPAKDGSKVGIIARVTLARRHRARQRRPPRVNWKE